MKHSVKVTIRRESSCIVVSNNFGKVWSIPFDMGIGVDNSVNGCVASLAAAMITGTIASHLAELSSPEITYTLTIDK